MGMVTNAHMTTNTDPEQLAGTANVPSQFALGAIVQECNTGPHEWW